MDHLKTYESFGSLSEDTDDIMDLLIDLKDDYDYELTINRSIQYYYDSKVYLGIAIKIAGEPIFINKNFAEIFDRLYKYCKKSGYNIHIDPDYNEMEFLEVEDFLENYYGDELGLIDVIIYRL